MADDQFRTLSNAALNEYKSGDVASAIKSLTRALALDPRHGRLWGLLGDLYIEEEQYAAAKDAFDLALGFEPESASVYSGLGRCLQALGHWSEAETAFARSVELEPTAARLVLLADVQRAQGKDLAAAASLKHALRLEPNNVEATFNLGVLLRSEAPEEARRFFERLIEVAPFFGPAHREFGLILKREGSTSQAEYELGRAAELDPGDAWAYIYLGIALEDDGRLEEAYDKYRQAGAIDPTWSEPHRLMGAVHASRGNHAAAIECFKTALERSPDPGAAAALGKELIIVGKSQDGREWLQRALSMDPLPHQAAEIREALGIFK